MPYIVRIGLATKGVIILPVNVTRKCIVLLGLGVARSVSFQLF